MKQLTSLVLVTVFLGMAQAETIDSLAGSVDFGLLELPHGTRSVALGGGGSALPGPEFLELNPASFAASHESFLRGEYARRFPEEAELKNGSVSCGLAFKKYVVGLNFNTVSIGNIISSDLNGMYPDIQNSQRFSQMILTTGFTNGRTSLGLSATGIIDKIAANSRYAVTLNGGLTYAAIPGRLYTALSVRNIGTSTNYATAHFDWGLMSTLPAIAALSVAYTDTISGMGFGITADAIARFIKPDSAHYDFNRITLPVGIEFWPLPYCAVRIGKRFFTETDIVSMGVGLKSTPLSLDASLSLFHLVSSIEYEIRMGVSYSPKVNKKIPPPQSDLNAATSQTTVPASLQANQPAANSPIANTPTLPDSAFLSTPKVNNTAPLDSAAPHQSDSLQQSSVNNNSINTPLATPLLQTPSDSLKAPVISSPADSVLARPLKEVAP